MPNYKRIRDPFNPNGDAMIVNLDEKMVVQLTKWWCSGCHADVEIGKGGRWTFWLNEPDAWFCDEHVA